VTPQKAHAAARLWGADVQEVTHVRTGENSVWRFEERGGCILRITSDVHRASNQLQGEVAFIQHLAANGLNVASPIESLSGEKIVDVSRIVGSDGATYAMVFKRLEGRHFEDYSNDIGPSLFKDWGRATGRLHLLSETFVAPPGLRRPDWDQDEVAGCSVIGIDVDDRLLELRNALVDWLSGTLQDGTRYGMVHGDLERTNFVMNDGAIGIFDFDDCCHHWFCWDIVCALWRFRNAPQDARGAFLGWFLEGYAAVREPDAALLARFSDLIRCRTIGLLLYRARALAAPATDEWCKRTRAWLDSAWDW
jgi:Ser/Thr protein kinase RdoA (MazF antagonist)